jgi:ubiquinone/menaquinone biosynthesis C-methylase UbiE
MGEDDLKRAYDQAADAFLASRTQFSPKSGITNREIEQPIMFSMVPEDLRGKTLLDAGCGPGIHLKKYIERGAAGFGVDISDRMIELARQYCPEGDFKVCNLQSLCFEDDSFDVVTSSLVLDHVKDISTAVREIVRVMRPGGQLYFSAVHPIEYMFRDTEKDKFVPSHTYFDKHERYYNIVNSGRKFVGYSRELQDYFHACLSASLILRDFVENVPKEEWKSRYPDLHQNFFNIPIVCFFSWEKIS